jgi:iduronate 2-sulfatase
MMRILLTFALSLALGVSAAAPPTAAQRQPPRRLNVLFIMADDLRPAGASFGEQAVKTPHLDALARRGVVFERAYCQQAVCNPSRSSMLTGRRPDSTRVYDNAAHFRQALPDVVTLPQYFKQHGYHTQSLGKIYHGGMDDAPSWSVPSWNSSKPNYTTQVARGQEGDTESEEFANPSRQQGTDAAAALANTRRARGAAWFAPDVPDGALKDGDTADRAIATLRAVKDKPFFLAVGFARPHLPFIAPKKYFDLYPPESIRLPANYAPPRDVPQIALTNWGELRFYADIPERGPVPEAKARELIRGYYAATSYADAQIGRVIDELERLGLRESTVVVVLGDHGWHLGEQSLWCKHTNFEVAARAPLVVSAPGRRARGARTSALVELVDLYPSLSELAGLPPAPGVEGVSFAPLLAQPRQNWKQAAFSQYPRGKVMGYSMKTDRYRYTEWVEPGQTPIARELYDHRRDPQETVNVAGLAENKEVAAELSRQLRAGWRAALPSGVQRSGGGK